MVNKKNKKIFSCSLFVFDSVICAYSSQYMFTENKLLLMKTSVMFLYLSYVSFKALFKIHVVSTGAIDRTLLAK